MELQREAGGTDKARVIVLDLAGGGHAMLRAALRLHANSVTKKDK
jgi:hypothetical protein